MPPPLALLLCSALVLFILRYDRQGQNNVSRVLWLPTLWMLLIASKPLAIWFGAVGEDIESGSSLDRLFLIALLCSGLFILARRRLNWSTVIKENTFLTLLIAYMLVSILWSDIPSISFKRWIRELTAVVMALLVLTEPDPRQAMQSLLRRTVYILIPFSFLLIKYLPAYGVQFHRWSGERMWVGVTLQKNALGRLCIISAFFLIWTFIKRWQGRDAPAQKYQTHTELFLLGLTLYLLKGPPNAYPATAIAVLVIGLATYICFLSMQKRDPRLPATALLVLVAFVMILGTITPFVSGSTVAGFTSALGRDSTLTGRTDIWAGLLPSVQRQPMLGCGFGAFWDSQTTAIHQVNEAHNGYLDVLLQLGFVGLLFTAMFLLSFGRKAQRLLYHDFDWGCLCLCVLLMTVLHNITESSIDSFERHLMANVLFLAVTSAAVAAQRLSQEQAVPEPQEDPLPSRSLHELGL